MWEVGFLKVLYLLIKHFCKVSIIFPVLSHSQIDESTLALRPVLGPFYLFSSFLEILSTSKIADTNVSLEQLFEKFILVIFACENLCI